MRAVVATLAVAVSIPAFGVGTAGAVPTTVNVRIEGKSETLFEGPVLTEVHPVKASSDSKWRRCDGVNVNVPQNKVPGVVPTSAAVDAMRIVGQGFDGQWYNQYEDYFLKRWGPDSQDPVADEYWGVLVNNVFTSVGGCQYQLDGGDEVLWVYDAFDGRSRLALYPADYDGGPQQLTDTAQLGVPYEVEVFTWDGYSEGVPPASPVRTGAVPLEGATVAPVVEGPGGFAKVDGASPDAEQTDADGVAEVVFDEPGWHRIKAIVPAAGGGEDAIRSNRIDVCVPGPAVDCSALPAEDLVRVPPPVIDDGGEEPAPTPPVIAPIAGGGAPPATQPPPAAEDPVRLGLPRLDRSRVGQGIVAVSWRVLDPGVGIGHWTIEAKVLGRKGARFVTKARGRAASSASLRLSPGATYRLRITIVDALGRKSTAPIGRVSIPG